MLGCVKFFFSFSFIAHQSPSKHLQGHQKQVEHGIASSGRCHRITPSFQ
jgi:hypothetical protein